MYPHPTPKPEDSDDDQPRPDDKRKVDTHAANVTTFVYDAGPPVPAFQFTRDKESGSSSWPGPTAKSSISATTRRGSSWSSPTERPVRFGP